MPTKAWSDNVGAPVALDLAPRAQNVRGFDVLCWNLAVGAARLSDVIDRMRAGETGARDRPLIVLAQEAYRTDETVPERVSGLFHGGAIHPARPADIVETARALGMSLRYSPSMRNGPHRSDRGNAILSTVALGDSFDFELPWVRQRRAVVTARIDGVPDILLASAHLDVAGQPNARRFGPFGAGRCAQAGALADRLGEDEEGSVIVGADLNTQLGMFDPALRVLMRAGLRHARRVGRWRHTYHHGPVRMLLDHVLYRYPAGKPLDLRVRRLDEVPGDRSRHVFGSDHHPLHVTVERHEAGDER